MSQLFPEAFFSFFFFHRFCYAAQGFFAGNGFGGFSDFLPNFFLVAAFKGVENFFDGRSHFFFLSRISARVIFPFLRSSSSSRVSGIAFFCICAHTSSGSFSANGFLKLGGRGLGWLGIRK